MFVDSTIYRKAFQDYIRQGTPIEWSIKREQPGIHYIWQTIRDGKIRSTHAYREGQIFAWDSPPESGHLGEDYPCRCTAESYVPNQPEFMKISLQNVLDSGSAWSSRDFIRHYYRGNRRGVSVRETGHLIAIVEQYMSDVDGKLKRQIAREARNERGRNFSETFYNTYDTTNIVFNISDTTIGGVFSSHIVMRNLKKHPNYKNQTCQTRLLTW